MQAKCAPDLLANALFPNGKEVTETMACFEASNHLDSGYEWNNPNVTVFVVGDGHKPRTAATFACRTSWNTYSIDPLLAPKIYTIRRLSLIRRKIEDCELPAFSGTALIVMPHSHAPIDTCLQKIRAGKRALITLDCCVRQDIGREPDVEYVDEHVWSPKNTVRVWRNV